MNKFLLLFIITFACVYADSESSESEEDEALEAFFGNLTETIYNNAIRLIGRIETQCPDIENMFNTTLEEVGVCLQNVDVGNTTLCSIIRNNLVRCYEPISKVLERCLPEKSKRLPALSVKIIEAIIDQACNSTVEQILELFNPCITKKNFTSFAPCVRLQNILEQHKNVFPSTASVCSTLPVFESCGKAHREASCRNPVTRSAMINFFEAIDSSTAQECQKTNEVEGNTA